LNSCWRSLKQSTKPMAKSVTAVERCIQKMTASDVTGSES
jgi:hypothetical protein